MLHSVFKIDFPKILKFKILCIPKGLIKYRKTHSFKIGEFEFNSLSPRPNFIISGISKMRSDIFGGWDKCKATSKGTTHDGIQSRGI